MCVLQELANHTSEVNTYMDIFYYRRTWNVCTLSLPLILFVLLLF